MNNQTFSRVCVRLSFVVLILICLPLRICLAQTDTVAAKIQKNPIHKGAWAVRFRLGEAFSRRGESHLIVWGNYFLTDRVVARLGLGGSL